MATPASDADPGRARRRPVEVVVAAVDAEVVADRLFALGASAVSHSSAGDGAARGEVALVADVDPALLEGAGWQVRVLDEDPQWQSAWRDTARAWTCGECLVVRPVWVDPPATTAGAAVAEVLVDPGEAFGSGSHVTTRLCLAALEPLAGRASTVLDVGCGSGVLGAAALVLGAGSLVAIDVDPAAIAATARTLELNGLTDRAQVGATAVAEVPGAFDLVLANLLVPIIEALGPELVRHVAPGGVLVASGLLEHQLDRALAALWPLAVREVHREDGWVAAVLHAGPA